MFELVNDVWGMKGKKKDRVKMNVGIKWSSFYCNDSLFLLFLNFVFLWTYDIFTYWRWQKVLTIVLCNCALRDGEPVRLETRMSLRVLKRYCYFNDVCSFVGLHCKSCVIMLGMENVIFFFFLLPFDGWISHYWRIFSLGPPSLLCNGCRVYPWVKRPGRGAEL